MQALDESVRPSADVMDFVQSYLQRRLCTSNQSSNRQSKSHYRPSDPADSCAASSADGVLQLARSPERGKPNSRVKIASDLSRTTRPNYSSFSVPSTLDELQASSNSTTPTSQWENKTASRHHTPAKTETICKVEVLLNVHTQHQRALSFCIHPYYLAFGAGWITNQSLTLAAHIQATASSRDVFLDPGHRDPAQYCGNAGQAAASVLESGVGPYPATGKHYCYLLLRYYRALQQPIGLFCS